MKAATHQTLDPLGAQDDLDGCPRHAQSVKSIHSGALTGERTLQGSGILVAERLTLQADHLHSSSQQVGRVGELRGTMLVSMRSNIRRRN